MAVEENNWNKLGTAPKIAITGDPLDFINKRIYEVKMRLISQYLKTYAKVLEVITAVKVSNVEGTKWYY